MNMTIPEAIEVLRNFKLDMSQPDAFRMVRAIGMAEEALKRRYSTEEMLNEVINDVSDVIEEYAKCDNGTHRSGLECARRIIRSHMVDIPESNTRKNGWIPVKERLPESAEDVLATMANGEGLTLAWFDNDDWISAIDGDHIEVIAWRPLPEPYREGEENQK